MSKRDRKNPRQPRRPYTEETIVRAVDMMLAVRRQMFPFERPAEARQFVIEAARDAIAEGPRSQQTRTLAELGASLPETDPREEMINAAGVFRMAITKLGWDMQDQFKQERFMSGVQAELARLLGE